MGQPIESHRLRAPIRQRRPSQRVGEDASVTSPASGTPDLTYRSLPKDFSKGEEFASRDQTPSDFVPDDFRRRSRRTIVDCSEKLAKNVVESSAKDRPEVLLIVFYRVA